MKKIFTVASMLCSKCQIDGEDFVNFCGLLGKYELYITTELSYRKNISTLLPEFSLTEPRHYYRSLTSFYNGPNLFVNMAKMGRRKTLISFVLAILYYLY